jgi:hypothetical protein
LSRTSSSAKFGLLARYIVTTTTTTTSPILNITIENVFLSQCCFVCV